MQAEPLTGAAVLAIAAALACGENSSAVDADGSDEAGSTGGVIDSTGPSTVTGQPGTTGGSSADPSATTGAPEQLCGNGRPDEGEDCDDGNTDDGDCCTAACTIPEPGCGNGCTEDDEFCWDDSEPEGVDFLAGFLHGLTVADLDGDGSLDIAALDDVFGYAMINDGTGYDYERRTWDAGEGARALWSGDLDNDGDADIVTHGQVAGTQLIYTVLNDGSAALGAPQSLIPGGSIVYEIAIGDVTGDEEPDLVYATGVFGSISVNPGDGLGGFGPAEVYQEETLFFLHHTAALGDFNGDGLTDVAYGFGPVDSVAGLGLLFGDPSGILTDLDGVDVELPERPEEVAVTDVDGDMNADVVAVDAATAQLWVLLGDGTGGFSVRPPVDVGAPTPTDLTVFDADLDQDPDLALLAAADQSVVVLVGAGDGAFSSGVALDIAEAPTSITAGDVTGDGADDLIVSHAIASPKLSIISAAH